MDAHPVNRAAQISRGAGRKAVIADTIEAEKEVGSVFKTNPDLT
jgi:hypothetical protein